LCEKTKYSKSKAIFRRHAEILSLI
jgi:hypothetical protein